MFCFALTSCHIAPHRAGASQRSGDAEAAERAYHAPPRIRAVRLGAGEMTIEGDAMPGARVRLASPRGPAVLTHADDRGRWRLNTPRSDAAQLFGLSMSDGPRTLQSEGYLAIAPGLPAAQLRAGSGAWVFTSDQARLALLALDYDAKGGAVLSGSAPSTGPLTLRIDGAPPQTVAPGGDRRFAIALDAPLTPGDHLLEVRSGNSVAQTRVSVSAAPPLPHGPFAATQESGHWRIDWMTPGGGVQTTLILAAAAIGS